MKNADNVDGHTLHRSMGLLALTVYGIGDMLGTGIYTLVGKAAKEMGAAVWMAYGTAMLTALLTGLSYASLGSRYPKAAGAAYITHRAFGLPFLAYMVGLAVMASGLTSMGTATLGFTGYFLKLTGLEGATGAATAVAMGFLAVLTAVNFRGIRESTWLNMLCTAIECGGLLLIIAVGVRFWGSANLLETPVLNDVTGERTPISATFLLSGAVLAFYSFVGFEDMLNVAEEVKDPHRTFPKALVMALAITTVVYMAVAVTAVSVVPHEKLAASKAPLVDVMKVAAPWFPPSAFGFIAMFAIANTALLNYIMGSRLVYGMARQGLLPAFLGRVHGRTRTPHVAILSLAAIVVALVLAGGIKDLADATSLLLLTVFCVVNAALIVLKLRPGEPKGAFEVPVLVPAGGILVCGALIAVRLVRPSAEIDLPWKAPAIAAAMLGVIAVMYAALRPRGQVGAMENG